MPLSDDADIRRVLDAEVVAVVGCSTTPGKPAHDVPAYLQRHGYRVIPINPFADAVLGEPAFDDLAAVETQIDVVDVFRPSAEVPTILEAVRARHADRGDAGTAWLQLGIHHDDAVAAAEADGLDVVEDRCMKIEHDRLIG